MKKEIILPAFLFRDPIYDCPTVLSCDLEQRRGAVVFILYAETCNGGSYRSFMGTRNSHRGGI